MRRCTRPVGAMTELSLALRISLERGDILLGDESERDQELRLDRLARQNLLAAITVKVPCPSAS
jgi:hypothetical protein